MLSPSRRSSGQEEKMKIGRLFVVPDVPRAGAAVVADSLMAAGCAVAATLIISADGGSLHAMFIGLRGHLLALFGG
jgi:hypothetical protein